nr:hypothetical protein Iba_scaffold22489CG0020 [Ipomoea batatas]
MVKTGRMLSRAATLPRRVVVAAGTGRRKQRRGKLSHVHHHYCPPPEKAKLVGSAMAATLFHRRPGRKESRRPGTTSHAENGRRVDAVPSLHAFLAETRKGME